MRSDALEGLEEVIVDVAVRLRERGLRVSTSEVVKAVELASSYHALTGRLTKEDLVSVIVASFTSSRLARDDIEPLVSVSSASSNARERAERIIRQLREAAQQLGARPGSKVARSMASRRPRRERRRALAAYMKLRRVGAIRGPPGNERLLDESGLERLAWRLAREGYESLDDAARDARRPMSWDDMLSAAEARLSVSRRSLREMSERRLYSLAEAAERKGDKTLHRMVAEEIARRLLAGSRVSDAERAARILESENMLSPSIAKSLAYKTGDAVDGMTPREIADVAESLGIERGGEFLARASKQMRPEDLEILLSIVDPRMLWGVKPGRLSGAARASLEAASAAARAFREALKYAETGEPGRADMAEYYAAKAESAAERVPEAAPIPYSRVARIIAEARSLLEAAEGGLHGESIESLVSRLDYISGILVLRGFYSRASSPEARKLLVSAMEKLLYRFASREGSRLLPRRQTSLSPPGRVDVRRTIYNTLRGSSRPIVYVRRMRANKLALALDASGSMLEYSAWAVAVASMFPRFLSRLVLFNQDVRIFEAPFSRRSFAEILLSARFTGYTNIAAALRASDAPGTQRIVVITDLYQTVEDEPVWSAVSRIAARGKRIVFIVPRRHNAEARRLVEFSGARVVEAGTPRKAAQEVLRSLLR